jgi:FixJ family two-component response regulator
MVRIDPLQPTSVTRSLPMNALRLDHWSSTGPELGETAAAEVVYLIAGESSPGELLLGELDAAGVRVRRFRCGREFLDCVRQDAAACIISDLYLPDMTAFDLQSCLTQEDGPPTIFVSVNADVTCGIRAIKGGAVDFLIHPIETSALIAAVREAFDRDRGIRERRACIAALKRRHARLTRREHEVFALVVRGFLNKQVAGMLAISVVTVQIHRGNLMRKMDARSFADLVCMAMRLEMLDQESQLGR